MGSGAVTNAGWTAGLFFHSPQAIRVHIQRRAEGASARASEAPVHFTQIVNGVKPSNWSLPWSSMVVQWLRFCASNEGGTASIPWSEN